MAVRDVLLVPDEMLKRVCAPLDPAALEDPNALVDGAAPAAAAGSIRDLMTDLVDTMRAHPGCIGLAAPQIGSPLRLVVIDVTGHRRARSCHGLVIIANPRIVESGGSCVMREGCLSIPDFTADVRRAETVLVEGTIPGDGPVSLAADAFEARLLLHEIDHLDGKLFLDRVESPRHVYPRRVYK